MIQKQEREQNVEFPLDTAKTMSVSADIPIIDLSGPQDDVARQLVDAAEKHGFIYIRNLGKDIGPDAIDEAFELSEKIFDSPLEEKQRCTIQTNNRGWSAMHSETLDPSSQKVGDYKEAFNFGEFIDGKAQQPLPSPVAPYEPRFNLFSDLCHDLSRRILHLLGLGLGVSSSLLLCSPKRILTDHVKQIDDFFSSAHQTSSGASSSILRFLRYPPTTSTSHSPGDVRAGAHSDYGSITLLFRLRGQAGLEILKGDNITWAPVPVSPPGTENDPSPPILVNIGDLLSYWTNGLFRSTVHRVVFDQDSAAVAGDAVASTPRYSIAFFCHPAGSTTLGTVPSERVRSFNPAEGTASANPYAERKVLTADEHLHMRLKASYGALYDDDKS
ncbi:Isopenicillin N synthase [Geosmithia morbida]|uniref:Isopenicillin N synthase n=1 Tax=Geosmithia morbida TaxID=1094350 RepID=A0A9P4YRH4_9HYPO|nr:Isopenicillin N synthase [Geosmithia morbida]KAF4120444.1 Isopenicillin N synthase [Geosmithia morbida]